MHLVTGNADARATACCRRKNPQCRDRTWLVLHRTGHFIIALHGSARSLHHALTHRAEPPRHQKERARYTGGEWEHRVCALGIFGWGAFQLGLGGNSAQPKCQSIDRRHGANANCAVHKHACFARSLKDFCLTTILKILKIVAIQPGK